MRRRRASLYAGARSRSRIRPPRARTLAHASSAAAVERTGGSRVCDSAHAAGGRSVCSSRRRADIWEPGTRPGSARPRVKQKGSRQPPAAAALICATKGASLASVLDRPLDHDLVESGTARYEAVGDLQGAGRALVQAVTAGDLHLLGCALRRPTAGGGATRWLDLGAFSDGAVVAATRAEHRDGSAKARLATRLEGLLLDDRAV